VGVRHLDMFSSMRQRLKLAPNCLVSYQVGRSDGAPAKPIIRLIADRGF
jgi:hypothetical protein